MKKSRIKWENISALVLFVIASVFLLNDAIKLVFSTIEYTNIGMIISLIMFIIWYLCGSWLEDELQ